MRRVVPGAYEIKPEGPGQYARMQPVTRGPTTLERYFAAYQNCLADMSQQANYSTAQNAAMAQANTLYAGPGLLSPYSYPLAAAIAGIGPFRF